MAYKPKVLSPLDGGTGVSNNAASTVAISGNFATTFTVTGATGVTLPTSGTLATTAQLPSITATQYDVLVGGAANAIGSVGPGSAGQVLQSGGNAANPAYSTATYPSTATGTGTLLRADGTNYTATTSTYPATNAINTLLYASSANVMAALATANNGVLATNGSGVPSITSYPQVTGLGIGASPGATTGLTFDGTNFLTSYSSGSWTPTIIGLSTSGTTTYTLQAGAYIQIGGMCFVSGNVTFSAATGTGVMIVNNLPFTARNTANLPSYGSATISAGSTPWPVGTTSLACASIINTTQLKFICTASLVNAASIQITNNSTNIAFSITYLI